MDRTQAKPKVRRHGIDKSPPVIVLDFMYVVEDF